MEQVMQRHAIQDESVHAVIFNKYRFLAQLTLNLKRFFLLSLLKDLKKRQNPQKVVLLFFFLVEKD